MTKNLTRPLCLCGCALLLSVILFMIVGLDFAYAAVPCLLLADIVLCIIKRFKVCKLTMIVTAALLIAALLFAYQENCVVAPSLSLVDHKVDLSGTVCDIPEKKENSTLLRLDDVSVNGYKTGLKIKYYAKSSFDFRIGDRLTAKDAVIHRAADNNEFYYHTLSTGFLLNAYAKEEEAVHSDSLSPILMLRQFRKSISERLTDALGKDTGSIAAALLIGDRDALDSETSSRLVICGASHLFAVSGMHLSLWTGVIFLILRKTSRYKKMPNIIASAFVVVYMILTGLSPSVMRAGIMLLFIFAEKLVAKKSDPLNSLGAAALLLLLHNVYLAGNISFLLSFAATVGIVLLYPYFQTNAKRDEPIANKMFYSLRNALLLTFAAITATAPVSAYFFGTISLLSPLSSLLCTLPVEFIMIFSFIGLSFSFLPFLSRPGFWICAKASGLLLKYLEFFSKYEFCLYPVNTLFILLWYTVTAVVALLLYRFHKSHKGVLLCLLLSAATLLSYQLIKDFSNRNRFEVYISANGNAACVCVFSNNNAYCTVLGTGGTKSQAYRTVSKLHRYGIYHIDSLIIPRISDAENSNSDLFGAIARSVYSAKNDYSTPPETGAYEEADNFSLKLPNGLTYVNYNNDAFSAGLLYGAAIKIIFTFYPGADYNVFPEELKDGDYLICRGDLPEHTDISSYKNVYVLTDKSAAELRLPPEVKSNADYGDITIKAPAT